MRTRPSPTPSNGARHHGIKARAVDEVPDEAGAVISPPRSAPSGPRRVRRHHVRAFHAACAVARAAPHQSVRHHPGPPAALSAGGDVPTGVASLVKTASWEWPNASVRAIDIEILDPERIAAEPRRRQAVSRWPCGPTARAWSPSTRSTPPRSGRPSPSRPKVSSSSPAGARGVTARSALALADGTVAGWLCSVAPHWRRSRRTSRPAPPQPRSRPARCPRPAPAGSPLTLAGFRAAAEKLLAARGVRETLATAQRQGTVAQYFAADTTDRDALYASLEQVQFVAPRPDRGLVHGAGVSRTAVSKTRGRRLPARVPHQTDRCRNLLAATRPTNCGSSPCSHPLRPAPATPDRPPTFPPTRHFDSIAALRGLSPRRQLRGPGVRLGSVDGGIGRRDAQEPSTEAGVGVIPIRGGRRVLRPARPWDGHRPPPLWSPPRQHRSCGRPPWPGTSPWRRRRCSPTIRCAATSSSRWCSFSMPYCAVRGLANADAPGDPGLPRAVGSDVPGRGAARADHRGRRGRRRLRGQHPRRRRPDPLQQCPSRIGVGHRSAGVGIGCR